MNICHQLTKHYLDSTLLVQPVIVILVHRDFEKVWQRFKVGSGHPSFPDKLLRAVCFYNSIHVMK
jgi:hypothetical protein